MPAPVAASILTLQTLLDLSDAETAEAAWCDLRWKVATGKALDDKGFHPSTLTYWRRRLARSARPHRINEAVRKVVEETGCTKSKTGRKIVLHERDDLLRQARLDWKSHPDLRERYRQHRPNVERVVSQIASRGGRRLKLRYRGTANNNAWLKRRTAGLNLRNLVNLGLDYAGGWVLAAA
jgi:hypothetical protein